MSADSGVDGEQLPVTGSERKCPTHSARKSSFKPSHQMEAIYFQADIIGVT